MLHFASESTPFMQAGNIRAEFQQLLVADIVIADISNVFYELGIQHALQSKRTFLIRARMPEGLLGTSSRGRSSFRPEDGPLFGI